MHAAFPGPSGRIAFHRGSGALDIHVVYVLNADGSGKYRLIGGTGKNRCSAGAGRDVVSARNGTRETVNCGPGRDTATVDRKDRPRGCERVRRR